MNHILQPLVPVLYYPLKTLFIDDNQDVLESYRKNLSNKYNILTMANSVEALSLLKKNKELRGLVFDDIIDEEKSINLIKNNHNISVSNLTLSNIVKIINDQTKYENIGIIVTDYDMPEINGIKLCEEIRHLPFMKILVTGKYDVTDAIKSLSNSTIDCFVEKGSPETTENIKFYINQLTQRYFTNLTNSLINLAGIKKLSFLLDHNFSKLIYQHVDELLIDEYYLIDDHGSYLLANSNSRYALVVYNAQEFQDFIDLYKNELPKNLAVKIESKTHIPFFGIGIEPENIPFEKWYSHFFLAQNFKNFYWSLIKL